MATVPPPEVTGEILAELAALRAGLALRDDRLPCPCGCGALYGDECRDEPSGDFDWL
jgi:hypothetical protein